MAWLVKKIILVGLFLSFAALGFAEETSSGTFDLENVDLRTALRILAKWTHRTVILSPGIEGVVTLHLQKISLEKVFHFLLEAQGLEISRVGELWYISPRELLIKQKKEEARWREIQEETSPLLTEFWQLNYAEAGEIASWLKAGPSSLLSKAGQVHVDSRSNLLCVRDTAARLATLYQLIKRLDVPLKQVLIETRLASVDSDYESELGLRFSGVNNTTGNEARKENAVKAGSFSLALAQLADASFLDVKLAALENEGHGELISSPSLFTANLQMASIEAGEEIPYQEASSSGATAVVFKKAVLSLKVTPQLLPGKRILLKLQLNQDRPNARLVLGVPTISTRQLITQVLISHGQTVVLGGIYEINEEKTKEGLPFLGKIPFLGLLFQVNNHRKSKRELLVFVTPRVIE
jgi:type IV pilus assembly protein PilQ